MVGMKWYSRGARILRFLYGVGLRRSSCGVLDEDGVVLLYSVKFGGSSCRYLVPLSGYEGALVVY